MIRKRAPNGFDAYARASSSWPAATGGTSASASPATQMNAAAVTILEPRRCKSTRRFMLRAHQVAMNYAGTRVAGGSMYSVMAKIA